MEAARSSWYDGRSIKTEAATVSSKHSAVLSMDWDPAKRHWVHWEKHLPVVHVAWKDIVKSTKYGDAHYKNGLPDTIETMEMNCVEDGCELPRTHPRRRRYYLEFDHVIGASKGTETKIVYAEWRIDGPVHGRPITREELKKKGM